MIKSILPNNVKFIGFEKPEPNHLCSVDIQEESPPPCPSSSQTKIFHYVRRTMEKPIRVCLIILANDFGNNQ